MDDEFFWTPPGVTADELEDFLTLRRGIPENANESIHRWLVNGKGDRDYIDWSFMLDFQQAARVNLSINAVNLVRVDSVFNVFRAFSETHRTWLVDFMLSRVWMRNGRSEPNEVSKLRKILRDAGSSWTVGVINNRYRLIAVLPGAVVEVVQQTLSLSDKASELLWSAWESAFGVDSKPSYAYYDAVRAVEVISCPLISPADRNATLGKNINVLRTGVDKWRFVMTGSKEFSSVEHVIHMMQLLWHSQTDRHGRADYEGVSLAESQAAVLLASTLVGWLSKGMLERVESSVSA
jgi:hypothetical protein